MSMSNTPNSYHQKMAGLGNAKDNARAYLVFMMGGREPLKVDADELSKIQHAIAGGGSCWVRQGNFNAKGYSHIVEDAARLSIYQEEIGKIIRQLINDVRYNGLTEEQAAENATVPRLRLKNIFEGVDLRALPANQNQLT